MSKNEKGKIKLLKKKLVIITLIVMVSLVMIPGSAFAGTDDTTPTDPTDPTNPAEPVVTELIVTGAAHTSVINRYSTVQLVANEEVTWKSSNKKIVSVSSSGKVKAKKYGTAYVTATAQDKTYKDFKFIVGKKVSKITLKGKTKRISKLKSTKLTAKVSPYNATINKIKWTSSNSKVASVSSNGVVKGKRGGSATIIASSKDGSGVSSSYDINVVSVDTNKVMVVAHRGLSSVAPENSLPAFQLAIAAGFSGVECDIWPSERASDGSFDLYINHDDSLKRMCNYNNSITNMTVSEIESAQDSGSLAIVNGNGQSKYGHQRLITLSQYLSLFQNSNVFPEIEIKSSKYESESNEEIASKLCSTLNSYGLLGKAHITSYSYDKLKAVNDVARTYGVTANTYYLTSKHPSYNVKKDINRAASVGCSGIFMSYTDLSDDVLAYAQQVGVTKVGTWVIDDAKTAESYVDRYYTKGLVEVTTNCELVD